MDGQSKAKQAVGSRTVQRHADCTESNIGTLFHLSCQMLPPNLIYLQSRLVLPDRACAPPQDLSPLTTIYGHYLACSLFCLSQYGILLSHLLSYSPMGIKVLGCRQPRQNMQPILA